MKNVWEQKSEEGKGSKASAGRYFLYSAGGALVGSIATILLQVVLNILGSMIAGWVQLVPVVMLSMFVVAVMTTIDDRSPSRIPSRFLPLAALVAAPLVAVVIYLALLVVLTM
ncbi:MAG: hypothetical protein OXC83_10670 [Chloroflexi bacterium]|nr:hypothetical protein [Chloroflexota bacterium]